MELNSVSCLRLIVFVTLCLVFNTQLGCQNQTFPTLNCKEDELDLVLIARNKYDLPYYFPLIDKILKPEEREQNLTRVRVAFLKSYRGRNAKVITSFKDPMTVDKLQELSLRFDRGQTIVDNETYEAMKYSTHARDLFIARYIFTETYGARRDAKRAIVIFRSGTDNNLLKEISQLQNHFKKESKTKQGRTDSILFLVLINNYKFIMLVKMRNRNIEKWIFPSCRYVPIKDILYLSVCQSCPDGWFPFIHPNNEHAPSCYRLGKSKTSVSWSLANDECQRGGSFFEFSLATIETKEELDFLRAKLYWELSHPNRNISRYPVNATVYIGLIRDFKSFRQSLKWINGRPVIYNPWQPRKPINEIRYDCGVWHFQDLFAENATNFSHTERHEKGDGEGWEDITCRGNVTKHFLCEMRFPKHVPYVPNVNPADKQSFEKAHSTSDFENFLKTIVSVTASIGDLCFQEMLKEKYNATFPLFDCKELGDSPRHIAYSQVCDGTKHCTNGRDEEVCAPYKTCMGYKCESEYSILKEPNCEIIMYCLYLNGRETCSECLRRNCQEDQCWPNFKRFDGKTDCLGIVMDDQTLFDNKRLIPSRFNNETNNTEYCVFICNRNQCIYPSQLNDGFDDCQGPEGHLDETIGKLESINSCVSVSEQRIWAPRCVYVKDRYDSVIGCRDMSHLHGCKDFECPEGYVKCPNSYCVPLHYFYNGVFDCLFGEDEDFFYYDIHERTTVCPYGEGERDFETRHQAPFCRARVPEHYCEHNFDCVDSDVCVHPDLVCDGYPQCPNGDDELNCYVSCPTGLYCVAGAVTVPLAQIDEINFSMPIDSRTKYLDLSGIDNPQLKFNNLPSDLLVVKFSNCKLTHTEHIFGSKISGDDERYILDTVFLLDLSQNLITNIKRENIFHGMTNLQSLNLSLNKQLINLHANFLGINATRLTYLDLSYTGISTLPKDVLKSTWPSDFKSGITLKLLNLSHTAITSLHPQTNPIFLNRMTIDSLDLRGTEIKSFSSNTFNKLQVISHLYTDNYALCCPQVRGRIPESVCHARHVSFSSCDDLLPETGHRILLWVMGLTAVVGNIVVVISKCVWEKDFMTKPYGLFVTNLGVSDLMMGIYLLLIAGADAFYRENYIWNDRNWRDGVMCQIAGFLSMFSSETSTFFICLITLDRYLVIRYPFGNYRFSKISVSVAILSAWCIGFVLALIPVLPPFKHWSSFSSNTMCLGLPLSKDRYYGWGYSVAVYIFLNFLLFLVIVWGQFSIYRSISKQRINCKTTRNYERRAKDIEVAKNLSLIVLSDFCCWFPIGLMGLLVLVGVDVGTDAYVWSAVLILPINSALNPLLYTLPVLLKKWREFKYGNSSKSQAS